jgi:hypothetical protein
MIVLPVSSTTMSSLVKDCEKINQNLFNPVTVSVVAAEHPDTVGKQIEELKSKVVEISEEGIILGSVIIVVFRLTRSGKLVRDRSNLRITSDDGKMKTVALEIFLCSLQKVGSTQTSKDLKLNLNAVNALRWRLKNEGYDVGKNFHRKWSEEPARKKDEPVTEQAPQKKVRYLKNSETFFIKAAEENEDGSSSKVEINIKEYIQSLEEIGTVETFKKFGICKYNGSSSLARLRQAGYTIVPKQINYHKMIGRRKTKYRQSQQASEQPDPTPKRFLLPPPPPLPVKVPIIKGGSGNRIESLMRNTPKFGALPPSQPNPEFKRNPFPVQRVEEEKLIIPNFKERPREPVPEILKKPATISNPEEKVINMVSRVVDKPVYKSQPKAEGKPRFSEHPLNVETTKILREEELYLYYSETQSGNLWIQCPRYILTNPSLEFAKYLNHSAHVSAAYSYELEGNIRKNHHPDINFLGTGRLIRVGTLRTRKPKFQQEE